jgi:hypothetical protein
LIRQSPAQPARNVEIVAGTLQAIHLIESVGNGEPYNIVLVSHRCGTVMPAEEVMAAKVKWALKAGYTILTKNVPGKFAPFNSVIRVSEAGTEDQNRDYLARIAE